MRRDKNDTKWQDCKRQVFEIDNHQCLLCQSLTVVENLEYQKSLQNTSVIQKVDPAHHLAVSTHPNLIYDVSNVFTLCRTMHNRLDSNQNPITGEYCSSEEIEMYWQRVINQRDKNLSKSSEKVQLPEFFFD